MLRKNSKTDRETCSFVFLVCMRKSNRGNTYMINNEASYATRKEYNVLTMW